MKTKKMTSSYIAPHHNKFLMDFVKKKRMFTKKYKQRNSLHSIKNNAKSYIDSIFDKTQGYVLYVYI